MKLQSLKFFFLTLCCASIPVIGVLQDPPKIALVLSGGGARGLAQIGVLRFLDEKNIRPDLIVATSMGAVIGALYSAGYTADSIASITQTVDWEKIYVNNSTRKALFVSKKSELESSLFELRFDYSLKPVVPNAISHGQAFYTLLTPLLAPAQFQARADFNKLPIPLRIIATDLISGQKKVLSSGDLCTALRASCAVPLAFAPVQIDSMYLVDGGIASNVPITTARDLGSLFIIAVNVTSPPWKREDLENPVRLVDQIVTISSLQRNTSSSDHADVMLTPQLNGIKNTDFSQIDTLISAGYNSIASCWDSISVLMRQKNLIPEQESHNPNHHLFNPLKPSYELFAPPKLLINTIKVTGNDRTSTRTIIMASGLHIGDSLTPLTIKKAMNALYATDLFNTVAFSLDSLGTCTITTGERLYYRARMGLHFDEFHLGEGYLEPAYENFFGNGTTLLMHLQYGLRREKYTMEIKGTHLLSRNIANSLHLQLYSSKESIMEETIDSASLGVSLHKHTLLKTGTALSVGTQIGRFALLGVDVRFEKFTVKLNDAGVLNDVFGFSLPKTLPYLTLKLNMDSMDRYPFPRSGEKISLSIGGATKSIGGGYTFLKWTGILSKYISIHSHTISGRLSFSLANNPLPKVEKALIGGAVSEEPAERLSVYTYIPFSGLPPRACIGDMYAISHVEYRCELKKNFYSTIMLDWGPVWNYDENDPDIFITQAPLGLGVGLAYQTIFGPLHFAYGQLLRNSDLYLSGNNDFFYLSAGYDF